MLFLSSTSNKDLMSQARQALRGQWGLAIICVSIGLFLPACFAMLPLIGPLIDWALSAVFSIWLASFMLALVRGQTPQLSAISASLGRWWLGMKVFFFSGLFVLLWSLLLLIPGLVAIISYSMTFYILAEDDSIGALEAIRRSKAMMQGNKWKYLCLLGRFVGWFILCPFTLGIGYFWLFPYLLASTASFYADLKDPDAVPEIKPAGRSEFLSFDDQ